MQRAFVTGANGFIGSALTRRLLREGVAVRAMCRNPNKGQTLAEAGAEVVRGDVQDAPAVHRYAEGCDMVFHVAAAITGGSAALQYNVNVQGTRHTIHAAHKAGASRFIHISSIAVYGYQLDGPVDESHPQRPSRDDFYMQTKALGEQAAWDYAKRAGLPVVVIRPAFVYGPGSGFWSRTLYNVIKRYPTPLLNGGSGNAHPIYIDDLVDLIFTTATHPDAPGQAFHGAPDPAPTWREFLCYYAEMAGNRAVLSLPVQPIKPLGSVITALSRLTGRPADVAGVMQYMASRVTFKMDRAASVLGWHSQVSLAEGMARTEPWLKRQNGITRK